MWFICEMINKCNKKNRHCEHQHPHKWKSSKERGETCVLQKCSNIGLDSCKCRKLNAEEVMFYLL